jgi:hypothetical protein
VPKFKDLKPFTRELRTVLFLVKDGDIFVGISRNSDIMYDGIIKAFNRAIA